jgi:hypothetical protein
MAKQKRDLPTQLPESVTRPIYAGVGVTDRVVEVVRDYVDAVQKRALAVQKDVQKSVSQIDLNADAAARRKAVEERIAALQADALALPTRLQKLVDEQVATAGDTFDEMVKRGESLVGRIRRQQSTQDAAASAQTTVAKAKTTKTQATKTAKSTTTKAKKTVKKSPAKSSAKATTTAASKTAASAAKAVTDAAEKIGD